MVGGVIGAMEVEGAVAGGIVMVVARRRCISIVGGVIGAMEVEGQGRLNRGGRGGNRPPNQGYLILQPTLQSTVETC